MKWFRISTTLLSMLLVLTNCTDKPKDTDTDTPTSGTISISVDETYEPIIKQQLKVFDSSFPNATINASYKSEAECYNDFINGEARLILVTRKPKAEEEKLMEERKIVPSAVDVAKDAIAIILNNNATDSVFRISQLKGILTGQYNKEYTVVFDNQGSSTLRYMRDSIIPGEQLGKNIFAANGNDSVIQYVANNPNAIGFVGVSYVSDFSDPEGLAFINNVKVAWIYNDSLDKPYKPYQINIAPDWYPLTRNLYYVHRETYPKLGTGFAKFLSKERGQLIFKQARLFPTRTNIIFRQAEVND